MLTLALPGDGSGTGRVLAAAGASGEPVWLTLRQLVRSAAVARDPQRARGGESGGRRARRRHRSGADRLHQRSTAGSDHGAAAIASRCGVGLRHHGDFDWGGLTIGNLLHRRLPVEPWQFDRDAYLRAVVLHPHVAPLTGSPTSAAWDPELADAMQEAGRRIEEELVAGELLESVRG